MNYYNEIKNKLVDNEINHKIKNYTINKNDLETYYSVGKLLSDAGKHYGEGIIKEYSKRLTKELGKGYTFTALTRMKKLYYLGNVATLSQQLTFGHYIELLPLNDIDKINYYIQISENKNLSIRQLRAKIKSKEYERLPDKAKEKLKKQEKLNIKETIPNPIIIKNTSNYEKISEKVLQRMITEDISAFLESLGDGYTFIKNEYKIKIGDNYNYIDLLLFNYIYNCFIVIELKTRKLDKRDIGQIEIYMNYVDNHLKKINHNKTIGIVICKKENNYIIEYASDKRIIARKYIFK